MPRRVLITGATGFIGANLARRMLRDGHDVHLLIRTECKTWRVDEIARDVRLHQVDLRDREAVGQSVKAVRPEWIFNLAAYGAYSDQQRTGEMIATNLTGCACLLDACVENGFDAFVQAGSSSEYGYKDHAPSEDESIQPNSAYAVTKAAATHYCQFVARKHNVNVIAFRLYSVYGPYEEPTRLIPTLIVHGLEGRLPPLVDPETARDFIYVEDAVQAMVQAASAPDVPRASIYNVCTGVQSKLAEVVAVFKRMMDLRVEPVWASMPQRSWDTSTWVGSGNAIARDLHWVPAFDFERGLAAAVDWFRQNPAWLRFYAARVHRSQ